jgi:hypothetical protein
MRRQRRLNGGRRLRNASLSEINGIEKTESSDGENHALASQLPVNCQSTGGQRVLSYFRKDDTVVLLRRRKSGVRFTTTAQPRS